MSSRWMKLDDAAKMMGTEPETILTMIRFRELPIALHSVQVLVWRDAVEQKAGIARIPSKRTRHSAPPKHRSTGVSNV